LLDVERVKQAVVSFVARQPRGTSVELISVEPPPAVAIPTDTYQIEIEAPAGGLRSGKQRLPVRIRFADGTEKRLGAQVVLAISGPVLVPVRDVARGERLDPANLRRETRPFPAGGAPLTSLPQGAVARHPLSAGQPVAARHVSHAAAVEPGQAVRATLRSGDVALTIDTVARSRGEVGQMVTIAAADGRPLRARVTAPGEVELENPEAPR
jgi:flagella basal body P-ring formation protein FlgA